MTLLDNSIDVADLIPPG